jgi:saccharopine dehydrogenase-like NADP-dependent oxidoreductase
MITVLGAGRVGGFIAKELARLDHEVKVVDGSTSQLALIKDKVKLVSQADLTEPDQIRAAISGASMVMNAVPGFMGFQTLKIALELGLSVVDIAFMPEDSLQLDYLAQETGGLAVVDFGVAPGLSNLLCAAGAALFDEAEDCSMMVGGLPKIRTKPWEYCAPFSPIDVLEEYTRPARLVVEGQVVTMPALSDLELVELPGVGTLEAFNTDGLRTLTTNILVPNMKERTLRYPGHVDKIKVLKDTGLLDIEPVQTPLGPVRPIDLTAVKLFKQWTPAPGDEELTVMRVEVTGIRDGVRGRHVYDLLDVTDPQTGDSSMARTTGLPAVFMADWILKNPNGLRRRVIPPEVIGANPKLVEYILTGLRDRGVSISGRSE